MSMTLWQSQSFDLLSSHSKNNKHFVETPKNFLQKPKTFFQNCLEKVLQRSNAIHNVYDIVAKPELWSVVKLEHSHHQPRGAWACFMYGPVPEDWYPSIANHQPRGAWACFMYGPVPEDWYPSIANHHPYWAWACFNYGPVPEDWYPSTANHQPRGVWACYN